VTSLSKGEAGKVAANTLSRYGALPLVRFQFWRRALVLTIWEVSGAVAVDPYDDDTSVAASGWSYGWGQVTVVVTVLRCVW
jgi:hypothetical protein